MCDIHQPQPVSFPPCSKPKPVPPVNSQSSVASLRSRLLFSAHNLARGVGWTRQRSPTDRSVRPLPQSDVVRRHCQPESPGEISRMNCIPWWSVRCHRGEWNRRERRHTWRVWRLWRAFVEFERILCRLRMCRRIRRRARLAASILMYWRKSPA